MPVDVAVLVPYRPDGHHRDRALVHVLTTYASTGWKVSVADDGRSRDEPWCKARAVANAFPGTRAEVYVVTDADCFPHDLGQLRKAVDACAGGLTWERDDGAEIMWAMPHTLVRRLSEDGTRRLYEGGPWNQSVCRSPYYGFEGGGLTVLRRDALLACPLDPRFEGWGNEDEAWGFALRTLYGPPWRGEAQLVHCWHPPAKPGHRKNHEPAAAELLARYRQASYAGPDAMRALLAEMR